VPFVPFNVVRDQLEVSAQIVHLRAVEDGVHVRIDVMGQFRAFREFGRFPADRVPEIDSFRDLFAAVSLDSDR
jgi:hypothetical protein